MSFQEESVSALTGTGEVLSRITLPATRNMEDNFTTENSDDLD